jgi:hypothetical protein
MSPAPYRPDLEASRSMVLALLQCSLEAQAAGRYAEIGAGYEEAYELLSLGRHQLVLLARHRDARDGTATTRAALIKLEAYKISMGADYEPLFASLDFLDHWMTAAAQGMLQLARQRVLWDEDARYVMHALEHGAPVDLDGIRT